MSHPVPLDDRLEWLAEKEEWRNTLPPSPYPPHMLGLKLRPPDPRDWDAADFLPPHAPAPDAIPASSDILAKIKGPPLNQGAIGSCVSHTAAGDQSIFQWDEENLWRVFDAPRIHRETGPIDQGRYPDDILRYGVSLGYPLVNAETRYKLAGYAFVQKTSPEDWVNTIKQCIAGGKAVWCCYLIPGVFGWESNENPTQGYHETLMVGYRPDPAPLGSVLMRNSWGNWGGPPGSPAGFGWLTFRYLTNSNWQNGYVLAHIPTDEGAPNPPHPPDPPDPPHPPVTQVKVTAGGALAGAGAAQIVVGSVLQATGPGVSGSLTVSAVQNDNPPPPDQLAITGYSKNTVKPGEAFSVFGVGFTSDNLMLSWGGTALSAHRVSESRIDATMAPSVLPGTQAVTLRVEAKTVVGPSLTVATDSQPQPGDLVVALDGQGPQLRAWATANGVSVRCTFNGTVGSRTLATKVSTSRPPYAAVWTDAFPSGQLVTVTAASADGRSGTTSRQF